MIITTVFHHSEKSVGQVVVVCLAHPEDGGGEVVVVGGVPVVLGHQTDSAPPRVASTALAWLVVIRVCFVKMFLLNNV